PRLYPAGTLLPGGTGAVGDDRPSGVGYVGTSPESYVVPRITHPAVSPTLTADSEARRMLVDTDTLPIAIPVPVEVPPGFWRRENTHCTKPMSAFIRGALSVVTENFRKAFVELGVLADRLEYREIGGWIYTGVVPLGDGGDGRPHSDLMHAAA